MLALAAVNRACPRACPRRHVVVETTRFGHVDATGRPVVTGAIFLRHAEEALVGGA